MTTAVCSADSLATASPPKVPPEWAAETVVRSLGRVPAAMARGLNRAADVPLIGGLVRLFSSVSLGIGLLASIAGYIAVGSGFPGLRARMEVTDLQFFDAWPMQALLALLALDLIVVTLRRIPLTLFKLGPWTVHVGILTLIAGSVWYFALKQEGAVRLYLNQSTDFCYDATERALYAFPVRPDGTFDVAHPTITPIPQLPIYYEHLPELGNPVDLTLHGAIAGSDALVHISGYYPSASLQVADYRAGAAGDSGKGPAIAVAFNDARRFLGEAWLLADPPADRVLDSDLPFALEYLHHPSPQRLRDLQASFKGPAALTVRIPKLAIERTYAVREGTPIVVEGSPYTLTPRDLQDFPLLSKGYENAHSTALAVDVERNDGSSVFRFRRSCLFRYPERSPDFIDESGRQVRKQDGVDPDIQIVFHDASQTQVWIVEADDGTLSLIVRTPDGTSTTRPLDEHAPNIPLTDAGGAEGGGGGLQLQVTRHVANAVPVLQPHIIPVEQRPRAQTVMEIIRFSMLDVDVSSTGWRQSHVNVPFFAYAQPDERPPTDQPAILDLPARDGRPAQKVALLLSTVRRALPSTLTLTRFDPVKYPGARSRYLDYYSTFTAQSPDSAGFRTLVAHLNNPASDHGLCYFQAAWDGDDNALPQNRFSVIGVANRPGIPLMVAGAILIVLGIGYAFYVKPILLRAKRESLARWSVRHRPAARPDAPPAPATP